MKTEHEPQRFDDGTIRIGGAIYGTAAEISDPHGWVWDALVLMDGNTPSALIEERLVSRHPGLGASGARHVVAGLLGSGYVEDAAAPAPADFGPSDRERYSRNHAYFRRVDLRPGSDPWEAQRKLRQARVLVLGLGGTGSHAAWALAASGVGSLHCVDPDVVEESNLTRQVLYAEGDIGKPKAEVAAERLGAVNSSGSFTHERRRVDTEADLAALVTGFDVFVLCADEPRNDVIVKMTNRVCAALGIPWAYAGYNGPLVAVGVYGPGGPCFECVAAGEERKLKPGSNPRMGGVGVIAPLAGLSGQLIAYEVVALITGINRTPLGYVRGVNMIAPDHHVYVRHPARQDCDRCNP
ncbi:HesA/MoeB/ThiF family protein [Streptomyces sp. NPDC000229]|uniref:HesA/MoeB/ThiF family protein n=1 Tax=Streptomyces sp. NPDC000229 TaxID=3154247 RepID=UPI00332E3EFA